MKTKKNFTFKNKPLEGVVKRHPDGFGFFIPDSTDVPDIYIPPHEMSGVMTNDRIVIQPKWDHKSQKLRGELIRIVARSTQRVMGQYSPYSQGKGVLLDHSHGWGEDLRVTCPPHLEVEAGDWVLVHITSYPGDQVGFKGEVTARLGDVHNPLNDALRILHTHSIPNEFKVNVTKAAEGLQSSLNEREFSERRDLREECFVTIDGVTAQDFDDAICVKNHANGFSLKVAIADVSHYVRPGDVIDQEAQERGTSVYFPDFVSPMLPELLSNELCSLKPKVPRLVLVADMEFDYEGNRIKSEFYEGVIESKARLTYGQAQEVIEAGFLEGKFEDAPLFSPDIQEMLKKAADLAQIFMSKRFREGSLDLEIPETEIEVDETGQAVDIIRAERLFAHKLIEEMMLAANVAVACYLHQRDISALYRIHEPPSRESVEDLERFLEAFGFNKGLSGGKLQKKMVRALEHFENQPQEQILHILTLRSMNQAKYSPDNLGHFGLGFEFYTHFTSPIRRYPDLIVHRLIKALLIPDRGYHLIPYSELQSLGQLLSAREQRAAKAERQVKSIKKARFMEKYLGEEFEGMISSVTKFGLFVLLRQYDVDGLIRLENLPERGLYFDENHLRLMSKKSGVSYNLGDLMRVSVVRVDTQEGKIDFLPVREGENAQNLPAQKKSAQKRPSSQRNRRRVRQTRVSRNRRKGSSRKVHS